MDTGLTLAIENSSAAEQAVERGSGTSIWIVATVTRSRAPEVKEAVC